jgi:hypothetical protein
MGESKESEPRIPDTSSQPHFSAADKRLALITFAATVAANLVTAVFVGVAILAYHMSNALFAYNRSHRYWPSWTRWPVLIFFAIIGAWVFAPKRVRYSRPGWSILVAVAIVAILGLLFWVFAILGSLASAK